MNDKVVAIGHNFMLNPNLKNEIFRLKNNDLVLGRDLGSLESNFRRILVWDSLNLENQFYLEEGMKEERLFNGGKLINIRSQTGIVEKFIQAYLNFPRINESSMGVYTGPNHVAYSYVKHEENSVLIYSGYLNDNKKVDFYKTEFRSGDNLRLYSNSYFLSQNFINGEEAKNEFEFISQKDREFKKLAFFKWLSGF
ncbi:MAG: hypothetical protein KC589_09465 [Nanoarchaeota archaeon]|nr:hypothetical protein [Nanoarchaeota archaeon]